MNFSVSQRTHVLPQDHAFAYAVPQAWQALLDHLYLRALHMCCCLWETFPEFPQGVSSARTSAHMRTLLFLSLFFLSPSRSSSFFFFLTNWIMFPASWGLLEDWDCLAWFSSLPLSVCLGHGWSPENAERWRKAQRSGLHKGRISGGCESLKTRWLWVQYLTAVWSWVNYLISLYLRFLTYKMRIILVCTT